MTSEALLDAMSQWSVAEGVPSAFAAARDGIDAVLRDRGLRRTTPEMTGESLLRGAHASAVLQGSSSSLDDVREGRADEVAQDALRVSTGLLALAPTLGHSPLQVLARVHTLAATAAVPMERLGRPRDPDGVVRLRGVAAVLQAPPDVPGLMVAALVHAELASAAPFPSHNGIVARAVERLVLVARGVDEKSLVVPEAGHLALRAAYESNLAGYAEGGRAGVHAWLLYAAQAYGAAAEASPVRS